MRSRHIVAMGGGGFSMEPDNSLLDDFMLSLTGKRKPHVCFVPTACGDADSYIERFHQNFPASRCRSSHLALFRRQAVNLRDFLLAQDVIYVGGGNTANMLAIWRVHNVDRILREAWRRGAVLCGISAGANCWFEACSTDSFGPLAPLRDGLAFLPGSVCPHYDGEPKRRSTFHQFIAKRQLPEGIALDDGAAAHFVGLRLIEVVSSRPRAKGYQICRRGRTVEESDLPTRFLGS